MLSQLSEDTVKTTVLVFQGTVLNSLLENQEMYIQSVSKKCICQVLVSDFENEFSM